MNVKLWKSWKLQKSQKSDVLTPRKDGHFWQTRCKAIMDYDTSICSEWAPTQVFFSGIKKSWNFDHLISLTLQSRDLLFYVVHPSCNLRISSFILSFSLAILEVALSCCTFEIRLPLAISGVAFSFMIFLPLASPPLMIRLLSRIHENPEFVRIDWLTARRPPSRPCEDRVTTTTVKMTEKNNNNL